MPRDSKQRYRIIQPKSVLIATTIFLVYILISGLSGLMKNVVKNTTDTKKYISVLEYLLGQTGPSTTLVLFTNNAEMRYGGGFIGSVGLIRANNGQVKSEPIRSVYYYDHKLDGKPALDKMPSEFKNIAEDMRLRDSGIYLNWLDDAKNAARYFAAESGTRPDNVVAVTPLFLKEILKKTGPIELKDYNLTVNADNLLQTIQLEVESGDDKKAGQDPKTILGVLGNEVLQRLSKQSLSQLTGYGDVVTEMIEQKQIMIHANDAAIEESLRGLGASGELTKFDGNYLLVAEENVGGNKSSPYIEQTIEQIVTIDEAGEATVDLKISRSHTSDYQHKYIDPHNNQERWLVGENVNFAKLALPLGSKIVDYDKSLGEIRLDQEAGLSTAGFWFSTLPQQTRTTSLRYKLPFRYKMDQRLVVNSLFEKQTGGFEQKIIQKVIVPDSYRMVAASDHDVVYNTDKPNMPQISIITNKNHLTSFIYER